MRSFWSNSVAAPATVGESRFDYMATVRRANRAAKASLALSMGRRQIRRSTSLASPETGLGLFATMRRGGRRFWVRHLHGNPVPLPRDAPKRSGENAVETMMPAYALLPLLSMSFSLADEPPAELEPVVVSASRVPIPVEQLGSSVTVIEREEIERRGVRFLGELLREVPGVSVARSGGVGAQAQVRIRGAEANHVLVLIDGVEANDASLSDEFSFAHLLLNNVERVEIVRGPHSSIWGSDSVAGVINVVTARSGNGAHRAYAEAGSRNTFQGGAALDWDFDRGALDLSVDYLESDGTNVSRTGSEDDGYDNLTLGLQTRWDPG